MPAVEWMLAELRGRGELWQSGPGLIGMRGDLLALFRGVERAIFDLAAAETPDEWLVPAGIALETLARADYFETRPHWLTVASHLSADLALLERVARDGDPASAAREASVPAETALAPALCYHAFATLAGSRLSAPRCLTAQERCWRHEGERVEPLARGWAFTIREVVCLGADRVIDAFRRRVLSAADALARALGLEPTLVASCDPCPAPAARHRETPWPVRAPKYELLLPLGDHPPVAGAAFDHHQRFFGEAFDIRLADGTPAESGCVAFGLERWVLAILAAHGPDRSNWPISLERNATAVAR